MNIKDIVNTMMRQGVDVAKLLERPKMDPNATLTDIAARLAEVQRTLEDEKLEDLRKAKWYFELDSVVEDLLFWLARGGFAPNWEAYPLATRYIQTRLDTYKRISTVEIRE